jgi:hypothetical protein
MRRTHASSSALAVAALLAALSMPALSMFSTLDYFPLPAGGTWTYRLTPGNETVTTRVLGSRNVNGANTTLLDDDTGSLRVTLLIP